ncbi:hypothetical protein ZWY2020_060002 [Hordeum vulgare]|nr:hypothetical protein ZWY2020_060002 [Hordeum vulgare]
MLCAGCSDEEKVLLQDVLHPSPASTSYSTHDQNQGWLAAAPTSGSMWAPSRTPPDSTTVSIAKVNSDYKQLDIAIVKATNHVERPAKEKHISDIFMHLNSGRARADVAYCIRTLARRLSKTRNWATVGSVLLLVSG